LHEPDTPQLCYRAFAGGVPIPELYGGGHRNYWLRFGQDHIDLCDVLSGYGATMQRRAA
jgi:3'-5' exonuclease